MAWTTPGTAVAGSVLTSAFWNTNVRDNSIMGSPVYTNEAARDAAIPAPVEGMSVYLTAPTIPAATGGTTAIPSGIKTIYNGSVWVCVTPIHALTTNSGTTTSASYTATLSGSPGTNPSVTLVTGSAAQINITSIMAVSTPTNGHIGCAVSGAGVVAASNSYAINNSATSGVTVSSAHILTGLTAGTNTFTLQYRTDSGTLTTSIRNLTVNGVA